MRWIMSDVGMSRASWPVLALFFLFQSIAWLWDCVPVLVRRGEYRRLKDNQYIIDDAIKALNKNARLREVLERVEYASRKDSLTETERLQSVRHLLNSHGLALSNGEQK